MPMPLDSPCFWPHFTRGRSEFRTWDMQLIACHGSMQTQAYLHRLTSHFQVVIPGHEKCTNAWFAEIIQLLFISHTRIASGDCFWHYCTTMFPPPWSMASCAQTSTVHVTFLSHMISFAFFVFGDKKMNLNFTELPQLMSSPYLV